MSRGSPGRPFGFRSRFAIAATVMLIVSASGDAPAQKTPVPVVLPGARPSPATQGRPVVVTTGPLSMTGLAVAAKTDPLTMTGVATSVKTDGLAMTGLTVAISTAPLVMTGEGENAPRRAPQAGTPVPK